MLLTRVSFEALHFAPSQKKKKIKIPKPPKKTLKTQNAITPKQLIKKKYLTSLDAYSGNFYLRRPVSSGQQQQQ